MALAQQPELLAMGGPPTEVIDVPRLERIYRSDVEVAEVEAGGRKTRVCVPLL